LRMRRMRTCLCRLRRYSIPLPKPGRQGRDANLVLREDEVRSRAPAIVRAAEALALHMALREARACQCAGAESAPAVSGAERLRCSSCE
jgi:hypothetical protein